MKVYSDAAIAALEDGTAIVTGALAIYCEEPVFVWGGVGTITIEGDVYLGLDTNGIVKSTGGALGGSEQNIEAELSGIDPNVLTLLNASELQSAPCKLYRMVFDGSGTQVLDCRIHKRGRLDQLPVKETVGGTASITASIESAARGLGRNTKRMRSDADQRLVDPADGFFKHVTYAGEKVVYFGGKPSSAAALSG